MLRLVLLRHGESTWNKENRFTGWTDVDLTDKGREEARTAGRLLKDGGFSFDLVFTSLLKRAIWTSVLALDELDQLWLPVERSWRRAYAIAPPPLEANDERHPARDSRYQDLPAASLPATESLSDTVARFLPYWHASIAPRIKAGRNVMIAAHGNSLRALVKYLDAISDDAIVELNIPTGIPLIYELDAGLRPIRSGYLGDPDAARKAAEKVAAQAKGEGGTGGGGGGGGGPPPN